jgi:RecB family exonuclease
MPLVAGVDLDTVFVLGMVEGSAPGAAVDDPLLPGHGLDELRRERERAAYVDALASAPDRRLSFSRADLRAGRPQLPSPWLLETARALVGAPVGASALLEPAPQWPAIRAIDSFDALVAADPLPGHAEARLRALSVDNDAYADHDADLAAGFAALRSRREAHAGRFDGVVGPIPEAAPSDEHPFSATRLQTWAECPLRYFLSNVLLLRDRERPEERDRLSGRDRGTLLHQVLCDFVGSHVGKPPDEPWSTAERAELLDLLERAMADAAARGLVGHPNYWTIERRILRRAALDFLADDEERRAERGVEPWLQEAGFGDGADDDLPPLDLDLGGRRVRFRGQIDRIDSDPARSRIDVYDYKTGGGEIDKLATDPVASGRLLQPALYATVVARERPDAEVSFHYWRTAERDLANGFVLDEQTGERLRGVLGLIVEGITAGEFPADPGDEHHFGPTNCRYCDFDRLCSADRLGTKGRRWESDPAFVRLRTMRDDTDANPDNAEDEPSAATP